MRPLSLFALGLLAPFLARLQTPAFAETLQGGSAEAIAREVRSVFEKCRNAVARVESADARGPLSGTGFFIDANGTLVTSYSVAGQTQDLMVCHEERRLPARRLAADPRCGVALLKIEAQTPSLPIGASKDLPVAAPVVAIGYPLDLPLTPAFGTIAGFDLKYLGHLFGVGHLRANLPVQEGEGGAPVLDMNGRVVGMLVSCMEAGSAAFIVPIEAAEKLRHDYTRFGELRTAWLGLNLKNANSAADVQDIVESSPAALAGIQKGDRLLQIGSHTIRSVEDVLNASFYLSIGDSLPIRVLRNDQPIEVNVTPSAPPTPVPATSSATPQATPGAVRVDCTR
jgi:serine protease Do